VNQEKARLTGRQRALVIWLQKRVLGLSRHWLAYPFVETFFREMRQRLEPRLERLREAGIAGPGVRAIALD